MSEDLQKVVEDVARDAERDGAYRESLGRKAAVLLDLDESGEKFGRNGSRALREVLVMEAEIRMQARREGSAYWKDWEK